MLEWLFLSAIIVAIFFISLKVYGTSERRVGSLDERRKEARRIIETIDIALEELASPLPDRDELADRWVRRIRDDKENDSTMSDTK